MKKIFLCVSSIFIFAIFSPAQKVNTANGIVDGITEKSGVISFKGIPYAAPPVGELRWKAPQPARNWHGILKAHQFGPRAMQPFIFTDMVFRSNGMSEDCLYLNIWTPSVKPPKPLPVLLYYYGGGFIAGDGSEPRYDGESMAAKGIVSITVNYRLGVFGLFAHPELTKESPHGASGNYLLMDQHAALKWVKENIAAFGGDPGKITIAGESAGSISVSAHMASPLSRGLIAGAIGESGSLLGALPAVTLAVAEKMGTDFAGAIGKKNLAELRAIPADSLLAMSTRLSNFRFPLAIDGYFFDKSPFDIYASGEQAHVPLLAGWNSEESSFRSILENDSATRENFKKALEKSYPGKADEVLAVYNPLTNDDVLQVATDLAGDRFIGFSTWKWIDEHSKTGRNKVFRYLYAKPKPPLVNDSSKQSSAGAVHSAEIEYALGNLPLNKVFAWTSEDYNVSEVLQSYFVNFIKTGNPNGKGLPVWLPVKPGTAASFMYINTFTKPAKETHRDRYLFLDRLSNK